MNSIRARPSASSRSADLKRRSGFTLVDTVTMVIAVSALLSLATVVLHRSFMAHRQALTELRIIQNLRLIGDRFRNDAATADRYRVDLSLEFEYQDQRRVSYEVVDGELRRSCWSDEVLVGRDEWKLQVACEPSFVVEKRDRASLIIFRLDSQDEARMPSIEWIARTNSTSEDNTNGEEAAE